MLIPCALDKPCLEKDVSSEVILLKRTKPSTLYTFFFSLVKGYPEWRCSFSENVQNKQQIPLAGLVWWFFQPHGYFSCFQSVLLRVQPCWFAHFVSEEQKKAGSWYKDICVSQASHVHDVKRLLLLHIEGPRSNGWSFWHLNTRLPNTNWQH